VTLPRKKDDDCSDLSLCREIVDAACCGMGCCGFGIEPLLDLYEARIREQTREHQTWARTK